MNDSNSFDITLSLRDSPDMKASFDITGIENAIIPIRTTCGW